MMCQGGGTGRRTGLKIPRWRHCVGSIPTLGTIFYQNYFYKTSSSENPTYS
jgi:hypothetical protein